MPTLRISTPDLVRFEEAATRLSRTFHIGDVVALSGDLGAGKTTFVAAAVRALHGPQTEVSSPTFTFWHRYPGTPPIEHLDLYRIEAPDEATELGLHEAISPASLTFIEWPERLRDLVPATATRIRIEATGFESRDLIVERP